jgi:hypothetical protein
VADSPANRSQKQSWSGRIVNAFSFIAVIICLGLWITAFILLKDSLFAGIASGNVLTNLTCIIFFGGLASAIFLGMLAGNILRRFFWRSMAGNQKKEQL